MWRFSNSNRFLLHPKTIHFIICIDFKAPCIIARARTHTHNGCFYCRSSESKSQFKWVTNCTFAEKHVIKKNIYHNKLNKTKIQFTKHFMFIICCPNCFSKPHLDFLENIGEYTNAPTSAYGRLFLLSLKELTLPSRITRHKLANHRTQSAFSLLFLVQF